MANELGHSCVVKAAIAQRDVTLDLSTAVDALHQVTLMKFESKDKKLFTCNVVQSTDVQTVRPVGLIPAGLGQWHCSPLSCQERCSGRVESL